MDTGVLSRLGVVSDEIHPDPEEAFAAAHDWGLVAVDLNRVWGRPVTDLDAPGVSRLASLCERYALRVVLVGGLPFKGLVIGGRTPGQLLAAADFAADLALLERSLAIARDLGAPLARVHGFAWPADTPPRRPDGGEVASGDLAAAAAGLRLACERAERFGVALGLENVRACHANSGRNTRALLDAVAHPLLRAVWDPANAYAAGEQEPFPSGYTAVRPYLRHVHLKGVRAVDGGTVWERPSLGAVDCVGQLRSLRADGYAGVVCLETHWRLEGRPALDATRLCLEDLRAAAAAAGA